MFLDDRRHGLPSCPESAVASVSAMIHAQGNCRVCTNGELVFSVLKLNGQVIIECVECMTGYLDPRNIAASAVIRMEDLDAYEATRADVARAEADDLIR